MIDNRSISPFYAVGNPMNHHADRPALLRLLLALHAINPGVGILPGAAEVDYGTRVAATIHIRVRGRTPSLEKSYHSVDQGRIGLEHLSYQIYMCLWCAPGLFLSCPKDGDDILVAFQVHKHHIHDRCPGRSDTYQNMGVRQSCDGSPWKLAVSLNPVLQPNLIPFSYSTLVIIFAPLTLVHVMVAIYVRQNSRHAVDILISSSWSTSVDP